MNVRRRSRTNGWVVGLALVLIQVQGCDSAEMSAGGESCWDQVTREGCEALGDACEYFPGSGQAVNGVCEENPDVGWCAPTPVGGNAIGVGYYDPASGHTLVLGFQATEIPPGWEACPSSSGAVLCPSPVDACQVCLCGGAMGSGSESD